MYRVKLAIAALSIGAASPAFSGEFFAVTPSGAAEVLFSSQPKAVIGALSSKCIDVQWIVTSSNETELVCEAPMNFGQTLAGQLLMGNSYSTPPRRFFRFNVAQINGISRVQASGWMELQMAFGQMKRTDFSGPEFQNSIINFMTAAGGKLPPGTTFPNHAMLGIQTANVPLGKFFGLRVTEVQPGSPADKAGIQKGDVVSRIANRRFKSDNDYLDAAAAAGQNPTYAVEIIRDGKPLTLTVDRVFRPMYSEQVEPEATPTVAISTAVSSSMADEMAKLAKLKADGVLSDAEFQTAKTKLLAK